jgi:hypothetical protein
MAQKVSLIDDLDGSEADETVTYSLDDQEYEIDLSEENAAKFRETLEPYIDKSRPVERQASSPTPMVGEADAATCYRSGQGLSVSNLTGRADDITTWRPASAPGPCRPRWMGSTSASGRRPVRAATARVA